jgi:hypothetical protein
MRVPKKRKKQPLPLMLSDRDIAIIELMWECEGIMARRQIENLFWAGRNRSGARQRLRLLYDHKYLNQPSDRRQCNNAPEHIYWLDSLGYELVGIESKNPKLKRIKTFNPMMLRHHLQVVDVRLKVMGDVKMIKDLRLGEWIGENQFRVRTPQIQQKDKKGKRSQGIIPDGFFSLWNGFHAAPGRQQVFGYLVEVDRGTEDLGRIKDKLKRGALYVDSRDYKERTGLSSGRFLMITTGWERAENMMHLARNEGVSWAWYFTTISQTLDAKHNSIIDPIWKRADSTKFVSLVPTVPVDGAG